MSFTEELNTFLQQVKESLLQTEQKEALLMQTLQQLESIGIYTLQERKSVQLAYLEVTGLYLQHCLGEANEPHIIQIRQQIQQAFAHHFKEGSLGEHCQQIIADLSESLKTAEAGTALTYFPPAFQQLSEHTYVEDEINNDIFQRCMLQVQAMQVFIQWVDALPDNGQVEHLIEQRMVEGFIEMQENGFNPSTWIEVIDACLEFLNHPEKEVLPIHQLIIATYGMALYLSPEHLPFLETREEKIFSSYQPYIQSIQQNKEEQMDEMLSPSGIIQRLQHRLQTEGFTEHAIYEAIASINKLPNNSETDIQLIFQTLDQIIDTSKPFATPNISGMLQLTKEGIQQTYDAIHQDLPPLSVDEIRQMTKDILARMQQELAAGGAVEIAYQRAMNAYQYLAFRLPEIESEGNEVLQILIKQLLLGMNESLKPYVSEDKKELFNAAHKNLKESMGILDHLHEPEWKQSIHLKQSEESIHRIASMASGIPLTPWAEQYPHIEHFVRLFPQLAMRFTELKMECSGMDEQEYDRLSQNLDDTMNLLKSAFNPDQLMKHQRLGLRRIALETAAFEKRKLLYFSSSSLPSNDIVLDANQLFYSGCAQVCDLVLKSCQTLELRLPENILTDTTLHTRWQELRTSAIAVFDFTCFNPDKADPKPWTDKEINRGEEALKAAATTALVAYECGWALALGKPMVIIGETGKVLPFDIDLSAVYLGGDRDEDILQITQAIQRAFYGAHRPSNENLLPENIEYLKNNFHQTTVEEVNQILSALESEPTDATLLKFSATRLFDLFPDKRHLILTPAYAGTYPGLKMQKVFHVSAFRNWSEDTRRVIESVCKEKNLKYMIGYEKLEPNIMAAVWKDICSASWIIADITLLNPNAVLELAIAQALGKTTLIIHQHAMIQHHFPLLLKTRTHAYNTHEGENEFRKLLHQFFDGAQD